VQQRFWSHGRDGCIHQWEFELPAPRNHAASGDDPLGEALDLLGDLLPATQGPHGASVLPAAAAGGSDDDVGDGGGDAWLPRKVRTLRVGFGGFCGMALLGVPGAARGGGREDEAHRVFLAAPAVDSSCVEVYDARAGALLAALTLPAAAAAAACEALLKGTSAEGQWSEESLPGDVMRRPGMLTALALLEDEGVEGGAANEQSAVAPAAEPAPAPVVAPVAARPASAPVAAGGSASGLRAALRESASPNLPTLPLQTPQPMPQPPTPPPPPPPSPPATAGLLVLATFETGAIFVLREARSVVTVAPAGAEGAGVLEPAAAAAADDPPPPTRVAAARDAEVLLCLPLSRYPILSFCVSRDGRRGCAATSGPAAVVFSLERGARAGARLARVLLPAAGASAALALEGAALPAAAGGLAIIGCWDGGVRLVALGGGAAPAGAARAVAWHEGSVFAAAAALLPAEGGGAGAHAQRQLLLTLPNGHASAHEAEGELAAAHPATLLLLATGAKDGRVLLCSTSL
jgi:hypothetical protein